MKVMSLTAGFTLASSLLCASAIAQTRFCMGGELDHLSAAQRSSCSAKVQQVRSLAATLQAPQDWHFVVVCGEEGWQDYAAFSGDTEASLMEAAADTRFERHETFLRESRIGSENPNGLRLVLAREFASILLHTTDRQTVEVAAARMLQQTASPGRGM